MLVGITGSGCKLWITMSTRWRGGYIAEKGPKNGYYSSRVLHITKMHLHNQLCRRELFLDTVLPHEGLKIRPLHVDIACCPGDVPVISDEGFLDEQFFDLLNR
jgi:hypothetical protein